VTRRGALAALERGRVRNSLIGGVPRGRPRIRVGAKPGDVTFFVSLPPPGRHHNVRRYPIAVVGGGYHGVLYSDATRIRGLVSIADVAPAVLDLGRGERPRVRSRADRDATATLVRLDRRLADAHDARTAATLVLVLATLSWCALGVVLRSSFAARAGELAVAATLAAALLASGAGASRPWVVTLVLAITAVGGNAVAAAALRSRVTLALGLLAFLLFYFVVLGARPEWNSLASVGPHPDGGGRFYGITNEVETLLLVPALVAGTVVPLTSLPLFALAVVACLGVSRIGADGGGMVVFAAGFAVLALRRLPAGVTARRLAVAGVVSVAALVALIALDAAAGGSSHVTHAIGGGPGSLAGDLGARIHLSAARIVSSWQSAVVFFGCVALLGWFATRRPRFPAGDALLVALAVSLVVNDTPTDIAGFGALGCAALWTWYRLFAMRARHA
jgi:hypothetical protein